MKKLLTISKDGSIKVASQIVYSILPEFVYLPITKDAQILVKKKKIKKGEALFSIQNKITYSSVSGNILNIVSLKNYLGQDQLYLKIKNDFQENDNYQGVDEFTTITIRTSLPEKMKEKSDFDTKRFHKKEVLILHGIEDEPYLANKPFLHRYYANEILQMLDVLAEAFTIPKIDLYFKETDRESIEEMEKVIGTYPNMEIHILPDVYPLENKEVFCDYLHLDDKAIIISTEEIMDMYRELIRERRKDTILVTITGDAIENPQVICVKIGSLIKPILEELIHFKNEEYEIYFNGLMNGVRSEIENVVFTEDVRAIYFMKKRVLIEKNCIHCGKCIEVCPRKCNPYRAYITNGSKKEEKCIHCGLCTFICPSNIELDRFLRGNDL